MDKLYLAFACCLLQTFACPVSTEIGQNSEGVNPLQHTVNIFGFNLFVFSAQAHVKL